MGFCTELPEFERVWPWIEKALEQEIGGALHSKDDVLEEIINHRAALWTTANSATLVSFIVHPKRKVINIWASGGKLKEILGITEPEIDQWGRNNGFDYIIGAGRNAWGGLLKKKGYRPTHTTFAKELI